MAFSSNINPHMENNIQLQDPPDTYHMTQALPKRPKNDPFRISWTRTTIFTSFYGGKQLLACYHVFEQHTDFSPFIEQTDHHEHAQRGHLYILTPNPVLANGTNGTQKKGEKKNTHTILNQYNHFFTQPCQPVM